MARYAISPEGVAALSELANNLIISANNIIESSASLEATIAGSADGLGLYGDEILSLVARNRQLLRQNRDSIINLAVKVKAKADEVKQLCSVNEDCPQAGFLQNIANKLSSVFGKDSIGADQISFCNVFPLKKDPIKKGRNYVSGNNADAYMDYWVNMSDYTETSCEAKGITYIRAKDIEGIYLSDDEVSNPSRFWSLKKDNGTLDSFGRIAEDIPRIKSLLDSGLGREEIILNYPELEDCYSLYFDGAPRVSSADGFYVFCANGRHRTLAAQFIDTIIPVKVTGIISKK